MNLLRIIASCIASIAGLVAGYLLGFGLILGIGGLFDKFIYRLEAMFLLVLIGSVVIGLVSGFICAIMAFRFVWKRMRK